MGETRLPAADTVVQTAATYGRDLAECTVATYVGAACAAGLAAVFSLLKGIAVRAVGQKNSASSAPGV
ncbi:hypothetical protein CF54_02375 [Streptomyces sp. Tu 6176]|uniref:hypothetical protein n=1 Tax=Streptomyces sp. Tu 6176 TaxID=1470557 RepID=UPI000449717D|nr:hypothetical protein [Streptomyces sp. Tu 6176]EYT84282.1 hypothetical protein CF54_02375 [Streptomyces sp. Tu 6176]